VPRASLRVRLSPRAGRNEIVRQQDGVLHVRVAAPPVDGEANAALIALLADVLGVRKGAVEIVSGASSREKKVAIDDLDDAALRSLVEQALVIP
jgi:uncharacterized protein